MLITESIKKYRTPEDHAKKKQQFFLKQSLKMKKYRLFISFFSHFSFLFFLLVILFCSCQSEHSAPLAKNGILDLRGVDFSTDKIISLDGEWEFFQQQFIDPDRGEISYPNRDGLMVVPGSWTNTIINGKPVPRFGFASYRLTILIDNPKEEMGIRTAWCGSSFTLFVDGEKLNQTGTPGENKNSTIPYGKTSVVRFTPEDNQIEVIIHVANFNHRMGGITSSFKMGRIDIIKKIVQNSMFREIFIAGCLFFMGIFYLGQTFINRKEYFVVYFSLFCLLMAIRIFVNGNLYLSTFLPQIPGEAVIKINYLTLIFAPCFAALYFTSLFSHTQKIAKKIGWAIIGISLLHALYVLLTPPEIFSTTILSFEIFILILGIYSIVIFIKAIINLENYALILFPGLIVMVLFAVNDILYTSRVIHTTYLSQWGLLLFTLFLSFVMARRSAIMQKTIENQASLLHERLEQATVSRLGTILGLAKLAEYRDPDTGAHLERLQKYSKILLTQLSTHNKYKRYITPRYIRDIYDSIILHDIGKVGVPDAILLKPGKLSPEEFNAIKQHPIIGGDTICNIEATVKMQSFLTLAREIAYSHHEKWDGSGYPYGLSGEEIPLSARICAIVDVYDALTSKRSYKEAFSHKKATDILIEGRNTHFDAELLDAFIECADQFDKIRKRLQTSNEALLEIKRDPYKIE